MRLLMHLGFVLVLFPAAIRAAEPALHLDPSPQATLEDSRGLRGTLLTWGDGEWESGLIWQLEGVAPPYYGAFAECYSGEWSLLSVVLDLTRVYETGDPAPLDAYLWADDAGIPGTVLALVTDFHPGPIPQWPGYARFYVEFPAPPSVTGTWWVGFWPQWPGAANSWYLACDHNGTTEGCMMTNYSPELGDGYPTGWNSIELVWGPHTSIGISAEVELPPTPTHPSSWGRIKATY